MTYGRNNWCNFSFWSCRCHGNLLDFQVIYRSSTTGMIDRLIVKILFLLSGTFSLQIRPVTLEDDGRFQCQVSPGSEPASTAIRSRYATLAVHIPPEAPQIVQGSHLITTEDREVELECQSRAGKPAAEVVANQRERERQLRSTFLIS